MLGLAFGLVLSFAAGWFALRFGTSALRVLGLLLLGPALGALWALSVIATGSETPSGCHDCAEYGGRWVDYFGLWIPTVVIPILWLLGTVVGAILGGARRSRRP